MIKYFTIEDLLKHYLQKKFHILAFAREGKSCPLKEICKMDQDKKYSSLCEERLKEKLKIDNNCFLGLFFKAYNIEI